MKNIKDIISFFIHELNHIYEIQECQNLAYWSIEDYYGFSRSSFIMQKDDKMNLLDRNHFMNLVKRLKKNEPIQYILGRTEFLGLKINLSSSCLIPRPETEELTRWIMQDSFSTLLDIGTGSGCIAITLAKYFDIELDAWDLSADALKLAEANATFNDVKVNFYEIDVLKPINWAKSYDVIVSNPPYVLESEKQYMKKNVLDFEPHIALFVDDDNSLVFYKSIIKKSKQLLNENGRIYFEINEQKAVEIKSLLEKNNFDNILIKKDIQGKDRMIKATKKL